MGELGACPMNLIPAPSRHPWSNPDGSLNTDRALMVLDPDNDGVDITDMSTYISQLPTLISQWEDDNAANDTCRFLEQRVGTDGDLCGNFYNSKGYICRDATPLSGMTECEQGTHKCTDYEWCDNFTEWSFARMRPVLLNNYLWEDDDAPAESTQRCEEIPPKEHGLFDSAEMSHSSGTCDISGYCDNGPSFFYQVGTSVGPGGWDNPVLIDADDGEFNPRLSRVCINNRPQGYGNQVDYDPYPFAKVGLRNRQTQCKERCITNQTFYDTWEGGRSIFNYCIPKVTTEGHEACKRCVVGGLASLQADKGNLENNYTCSDEQIDAICSYVDQGGMGSPCCKGGGKCRPGLVCKGLADDGTYVPIGENGIEHRDPKESDRYGEDVRLPNTYCGMCMTGGDSGHH